MGEDGIRRQRALRAPRHYAGSSILPITLGGDLVTVAPSPSFSQTETQERKINLPLAAQLVSQGVGIRIEQILGAPG